MKTTTIFLMMILITPYLQAQSYTMRISQKDGTQMTVATESIKKMMFTFDETHALLVTQKDGSQFKSTITNVSNITFSEVTAIEPPGLEAAKNNKTFILYQNHPNPFNNVTAISYQLSAMSNVEISIYDLLGKKITTLVHQDQERGFYQTRFNASELESGIYFCQLRIGEHIQTRKMLFIK